MGTVRERRPGHFELRAYAGRSASGSPVYLQETFVSARKDTGVQEARRRLRELERRAAKARSTDAFGSLLDRFLEYTRARRAPTTVHGYEVKAKAIRKALGDVRLDLLSVDHLDRWYTELLTAGTSPAMVRHYHRIISATLARGVKWRLVPANVALQVTPPRVPRRELRPPTPEQLVALIREAEKSRSPIMASVIAWAAVSAMRRGEICGLRRLDVGDIRAMVRRSIYQLPQHNVGEKDPKTHQRREVPIEAEALAVLAHRRATAETDAAAADVELLENGYVWSTDIAGGEPLLPDRITQAFRRIAARAGVDCRFHDLRHFGATQLLARGVDVVTVAGILGHERPSTTMDIYGHVLEESSRTAAAVLGSLIAPALMPAESANKPRARKAIAAGGAAEGG